MLLLSMTNVYLQTNDLIHLISGRFIVFITGPDDPCQLHKTTWITIKHIYLHIQLQNNTSQHLN